MIYQASSDVNKLVQTAQETVEPFRKIIGDAVESSKLEGIAETGEVKIRVKGRERLAEKIETKYPAEEVSDYLAARLPVDSIEDAAIIVKNLSRAGRVISDNNSYQNPVAGYRSRHLQIELPNGLSVELQLPVKEMYEAQLKAHKKYNIFRNSTDPNAVRKAMLESEDIFSEGWNKYQKRIGAKQRKEDVLRGRFAPGVSARAVVDTRPGAEAIDTKVRMMGATDIHADTARFQPRAKINEERVATLSESMKNRGFDPSEPITVWTDPKDGNVYVLGGHHRMVAAERAGISDIPTRMFQGTEAEAVDFAWTSNSRINPLSPMSEARAFGREVGLGRSVSDISKRFGGIKATQIRERLALNELTPELQEMVDAGTLRVGHAVALGRAVKKHGLAPELQMEIFNSVIKKMEVTPAELTSMIETIAPHAKQQMLTGLGLEVSRGFLDPLMERIREIQDLKKSRSRLRGILKDVSAREKSGRKVSWKSLSIRRSSSPCIFHISFSRL